RSRFGINTLLNRMAGHGAAEPERASPALRAQPRVSATYEEEPELDPDQERIEIPAFLRRQAN
ncbi:MAG: cell division protein FtsZ, partial [Albidovulum sp.]